MSSQVIFFGQSRQVLFEAFESKCECHYLVVYLSEFFAGVEAAWNNTAIVKETVSLELSGGVDIDLGLFSKEHKTWLFLS